MQKEVRAVQIQETEYTKAWRIEGAVDPSPPPPKLVILFYFIWETYLLVGVCIGR